MVKPLALLFVFMVAIIGSINAFVKSNVVRVPFSGSRMLAAAKHKVTIQHDGKETVLEVREDESVLNAALDAGIDMPYDCNMGVCLTCPSKVISGTPDHTGSTLEDSVLQQGFALTCCLYPRSDMVVASIEEDELVNAQFSGRT